MGVSTDGKISYGIEFPEGFYFPWVDHDDIEDWWLDVNGYKPPFEIYDEEGEYIGGVRPSDETIKAYFESRRIFHEKHPLPVELVNTCSYDYPMYILALKGTVMTANRGFPKTFDPASLTKGEDPNRLIEFCRTHNIDTGDKQPAWYLSSFWG